jgi:hypothetical protein
LNSNSGARGSGAVFEREESLVDKKPTLITPSAFLGLSFRKAFWIASIASRRFIDVISR